MLGSDEYFIFSMILMVSKTKPCGVSNFHVCILAFYVYYYIQLVGCAESLREREELWSYNLHYS